MKNLWTRLALYLTLFNALLTFGCGTVSNKDLTIRPPVDNPRAEAYDPPEIDPDMQPLVDQWLIDCQSRSNLHCGSLLNKIDSVKIVEDYGDAVETVGRCNLSHTYGWVVVERHITLRRDILSQPYTARATFAHEMGHCAFLFEHDESEPNLLMNPYILPEVLLQQKLDWILAKFYMGVYLGTHPRIGMLND